jgi:hypothetical protein
MTRTAAFTTAAVLAALCLGPPAASADQRGSRGGQGQGRSEARQQNRAGNRDNRSRGDERRAQPPQDRVQAAPSQRPVPRNVQPYERPDRQDAQRYRPGEYRRDAQRSYDARRYEPRPYAPRPTYGRPYDAGRYYPRQYVPRAYYYAPRVYRPWVLAPYYSPLYVFRPRFTLSFGISLGYPVPYYAYPYPVAIYGPYAPPSPVVVGPGSSVYGGISLEIHPDDAEVYVDGGYAGLVRDFNGYRQPLTLTAGRHHIVIDAPGYQVWEFDVDVIPGQVLPYRGDLQP